MSSIIVTSQSHSLFIQIDYLQRAVENSFIFQRVTDDYGKLYSIIPNVSKMFPEWSGYKAGRESSVVLYNIFKVIIFHINWSSRCPLAIIKIIECFCFSLQKIIDEQIQTYDASHERHFIDMYINQMQQRDLKTEEKTYFTCNKFTSFAGKSICKLILCWFQCQFSDEQLVLTCVDFSLPSLSAVPTTLAFLFQQMCLEPEVQRKVQKEIDKVVGQGRAPTLSDRIKYVQLKFTRFIHVHKQSDVISVYLIQKHVFVK